MNTSQTRSAVLLNLLFGCLLLLMAVMPQAAAEEEAPPDCGIPSIISSFKARFPEGRIQPPNDEIKNIQKQLFAVGYHPGRIDGLLGDDTDKALAQFCLSVRADEIVNRNNQENGDTKPGGLATNIVDLLEKIDFQEGKPKKILLSGGGCGCSREFKDNSLVYGFYPHWLADGDKQVVDFSLFDRIGFYALELNQQGFVKRAMQWPSDPETQPNVAEFISQAHKHKVDVDVSFYASSWQSWEQEQIDRATDIIVETVTRKFESDTAPWWRKYVPLVANRTTASADGVNLFFDDYAESENGGHLVDIVEQLASKLKQEEPDAKLNIMLGLNLAYVDKLQLKVEEQTPGQFVEQYRTLENEFRKLERQFKALEEILDADQKTVDYVFVFLAQDTSRSKKNLRQIIENAFEGAARQTVLRKIVPIVVAQGLAEQGVEEVRTRKERLVYGDGKTQFKDDLIYMQNNFTGIGLWHLPLTQSKEDSADEIAKLEIAEKEAAELAAAAKEAAAAAKEAADRATVATEMAKNASADDAAAMKQAAEKALVEKKIAEQEAGEKAKAADEKTAAMEATKKKKEAPQKDVDTLRDALKNIYQVRGEFAFLGETIAPYANSFCEYACPNRWRFYTAIGVLLALAVIYTLLALRYCRLREFYQRRFIYFAGFGFVTAMIITVTLICDPFWKQRAAYVLIAILLLIVAGYGLRRLRRAVRPQMP
jgi:hypothetical protein